MVLDLTQHQSISDIVNNLNTPKQRYLKLAELEITSIAKRLTDEVSSGKWNLLLEAFDTWGTSTFRVNTNDERVELNVDFNFHNECIPICCRFGIDEYFSLFESISINYYRDDDSNSDEELIQALTSISTHFKDSKSEQNEYEYIEVNIPCKISDLHNYLVDIFNILSNNLSK